MLHRALFGSLERFTGILIEHYEGKFPFWLAPVQAVVLNITDKQADYAKNLEQRLKSRGIRVVTDLRNEKVGFKIREHTLQAVPYLLVTVIEMANDEIAVRTQSGKTSAQCLWTTLSPTRKAKALIPPRPSCSWIARATGSAYRLYATTTLNFVALWTLMLGALGCRTCMSKRCIAGATQCLRIFQQLLRHRVVAMYGPRSMFRVIAKGLTPQGLKLFSKRVTDNKVQRTLHDHRELHAS